MLIPIPWVHAGLGVLTAALSIPLIARKVPPNGVYGFRMAGAFASESNWYSVNAYGGKWLLFFGVVLLCCAGLGWQLAPPPSSPLAPVYLIVPLALLIPIILLVNAYANGLSKR